MKIIKKITLIIILILGLTACFNNESNIIETTKENRGYCSFLCNSYGN